MYQKSTQKHSEEYCQVMGHDVLFRPLNPRKDTLTLIMQFAAAYHVEKKLSARLSGIILN